MTYEPIVAEQTYDASIAIVWAAITDPEQMRQWFFQPMEDFKPEVGFETEFTVHHEGTDYVHQWRITEVDEPEKIVYRWVYAGVPGVSTVTWKLMEADKGGTQLHLTHEIIESFPQENPIFSREAGQNGWNYFLNESLQEFLESQK